MASGHEAVSSSPLVPHNDPTLMFTSAGKELFIDGSGGPDGSAAFKGGSRSGWAVGSADATSVEFSSLGAWAAGLNDKGQLGIGVADGECSHASGHSCGHEPVQVSAPQDIRQIAVAWRSTLGMPAPGLPLR